MIRNYFKIAWRNIVKNKSFSAINISGLAIGIATCLIILLFVQDELSYDRFNQKAGQIVRVVFRGTMNGEKMKEAFVMAPTAQTILHEYPEALEATRLRNNGTPKVIVQDKTFKDAAFAYVDANFFQIFTLPFIKGDAKTALVEPNSVVITQSLARKYFGNEDPMGKSLNFKDANRLYKITGLIEDVPANSHFHFDLFGSMESYPDAKNTSWMGGDYYTYLLLQKGYDYKKLEAKLPQMVDKYMAQQLKQALGVSLSDFRQKGNDIGLYLQPLKDIHLHSDFTVNLEPGGDIRYVYIFGAIALFMLLIACINFMNLSTAGASKRAKEVGIRKTLGSDKYALVGQFMFESVLLTFLSLILALILVKIALPVFNDLSGKRLNLSFSNNPAAGMGLILFGLAVSFLSGIYPAFYLSSFNPVSVLKSKFAANGKSVGFRSGLVVFQFIISIILIVGTTVVYRQLQYIQNKKLGYDKEQLLILRNSMVLGANESVFKEQLLRDPRVVNVTTSAFLPAGPTDTNMSSCYPDGYIDQNRRTLLYQIDDAYIPTMGMQIAEGRNFSKEFSTDSTSVIVNETLAKIFGWGKDAAGHTVNRFTNNAGEKKTYKVVGIVKDFHFKSLHEEIAPLMMVLEKSPGLIVKVKTKDVPGLLASMKNQWDAFHAEEPFTYAFVDELFNKTYLSEQKTGTILSIFSGLTIFIACLGLFGLTTFTAEQRTKEIGVRKVLGATAANIVLMLSKDFILLVGLAVIVATPVSWWAMRLWLQDFAYRITIGWWIFALAGFSALLIALITVSFQAIKAAVANPVKSLRTE